MSRACGLPQDAPRPLALLVLWLGACGGNAAEGAGTFGDAPSALALRGSEQEAGDLALSADAPKVVFLGDSITAGLHLPETEAFPAQAQRALAAEGCAFLAVNAGVSGDTSAGGLRRLDWVLQNEPDLLVLELGGNDGLRGLPLETLEANLRQIIERTRARGIPVLLLGMRLPPSYGAEYVAGFAQVYASLAQELELAFVPFFMEGVGGVRALNLEDGLHPSARGHAHLAENILPALRDLLCQD